MEKPLEAAYVGPKLDGVGYQEITRVGRTVLARLMEIQIWCPSGLSWKFLTKEQ